MWDIVACWPAARLGEVVTITCPNYFSYFSDQHKGKYLLGETHACSFCDMFNIESLPSWLVE